MPDAMQHYMKGLELFGKDQYFEAISEYEKGLELEPERTDLLLALATAQMNAGKLEEAIASGQKLVGFDPEDPFAHTTLSMIFQRKGMIDEAEKEQAKARMLSWKQELKENPDAAPPGPAGGMGVIQ